MSQIREVTPEDAEVVTSIHYGAVHMCEVEDFDLGTKQVVLGKFLSKGFPIRLEAGNPLQLLVSPSI